MHACGVGPQVRVELLRAVVHGKRDGHGVVADAEVVVETERHVGDFNVAHDVETNVVFDGAERGYVPGTGWCNIFMVESGGVVGGGGGLYSFNRSHQGHLPMQAWEELELRRAIWLPVMSLCSGIAATHDKNKAMGTSTSKMRIVTGNGASTLHAIA